MFAEQEENPRSSRRVRDEIILGPTQAVPLAPHFNGSIPCSGASERLERGKNFLLTRNSISPRHLIGGRPTNAACIFVAYILVAYSLVAYILVVYSAFALRKKPRTP